MTLYHIYKPPKDSTETLLELIQKYSKAAWYKTSTQKSVTFLYTNNELWETEIKNTQMERHSVSMNWKNIVKISVFPKAAYRFNAILLKKKNKQKQWYFFTEMEKKSKICMELQKTWIAKAILRKNKAWGNHMSRSQTILYSYSNQNSMELA